MLQPWGVEPAIIRDDLDARTLGQQLELRLERLLHAVGQAAQIPRARAVAALLGGAWLGEPMASGPRWPSDITDDHTPFELSLALHGAFEGATDAGGDVAVANGHTRAVRILTEPQDPRAPSLQASWQLGASIHEALASRWGASLEAHDQVADLFAPSAAAAARFSVWHSAVLSPASAPLFKVYLNPAIHAEEQAEAVLEAALGRLGLLVAWGAIRALVLARPGLDVPVYVSLDLERAPAARLKLYVAHRHAQSRDLVRLLGCFPGFEERDVERWLELLLGPAQPYAARPPISCFAFERGRLALCSTTLHLPVRCYLPDDLEIARRACSLLTARQQVAYLRALTLVAERPLQAGRGLQTYVSLRASPGRQALTVYLAPQVYTPCESAAGARVT